MNNKSTSKKDWNGWLKWAIPVDVLWQLLFFSAVFVLRDETFINFRQMTPEKWAAMTETVVPKQESSVDFFLSLLAVAKWVIGILFVVTLVVYLVLHYREKGTILSKPFIIGGVLYAGASGVFYAACIMPVVEYPAIFDWMNLEFVSLWLAGVIIVEVRKVTSLRGRNEEKE